MSKLTIDQLRDLYVHSVRTHETELHLRAKAHRQARRAFDRLIADIEHHAIQATNNATASRVRRAAREAAVQAWDECCTFHDEQGMGLADSRNHNPYQPDKE